MLGNLNTQTIEEILHGPVMQEIRQTIRSGKLHEKYCYNCIQAERYGRSERDWHNNISSEFDPATATDTEHRPTLIDVRWNTTCNLSCNYCAPSCSSGWAALKGVPVKSGTRPYYEQVCDYLEQHKDNIREVALVGGEPLLLPENVRLLDVIPKDCSLALITNGSVDLTNNKIFRKLTERRRVGWSISFDNTGEQFEYVRYGGSWDLLLSNIKQIQNLIATQGHWGGIHAVYNLYNATQLVEFTRFARENNLDMHWQSLYQPDCLDPQRLGPEIRALALAEIDSLLSTSLLQKTERPFFESVRQNFNQSQDDLREDLDQHIKDIENKYHPDQQGKFAQLWPEISKLL
jgi:organic radical activating enzyme